MEGRGAKNAVTTYLKLLWPPLPLPLPKPIVWCAKLGLPVAGSYRGLFKY